MKSATKRLIYAAPLALFGLMWGAHYAGAQQEAKRRPLVTAIRLFTGPDGQTHAEKIDVAQMPNLLAGTNVRFGRVAAGTIHDWHTSPHRQYLVTLSGHAEIELGSGEKVPQEPGVLLLTDDLTGKGHLSRALGTEDMVFMEVSISDK